MAASSSLVKISEVPLSRRTSFDLRPSTLELSTLTPLKVRAQYLQDLHLPQSAFPGAPSFRSQLSSAGYQDIDIKQIGGRHCTAGRRGQRPCALVWVVLDLPAVAVGISAAKDELPRRRCRAADVWVEPEREAVPVQQALPLHVEEGRRRPPALTRAGTPGPASAHAHITLFLVHGR